MIKQININKLIFGATTAAIILFAALYLMTYDTSAVTSTNAMQWQSDSTWTVGW
jgi:hypothetical protein